MESIALTWSISVQELLSTCSQVALQRGIWAWPQGGFLCCAAFSSGFFVLVPQQSRGCGPTLSKYLTALTCTRSSCASQQCCRSPRCLLCPPVGTENPPPSICPHLLKAVTPDRRQSCVHLAFSFHFCVVG